MERALVLSADRWTMTDERTGKQMSGVSVWFLNSYRDDSSDSVGWKPAKIGANDSVFDSLRKSGLPALCEMEFGAKPGPQGKAVLTLVGIKPLKSVNLFAAEK